MIEPLQHADCVIWDWDGTLVESIELIYKAHNHVRSYFKQSPWRFEEFQKVAHQSTMDVYPSLYGARAPEAITILYDYFAQEHLKHTTVIDGAKEALDTLLKHEIPMILVSNKKHEFLLKEMAHFGFSSYFLSAVGAGYASKDKPDKAPVLQALKEAHIEPTSLHTACFIGDSQTDIECAHALPFPTYTCIIGTGVTEGEDLRFTDIKDLFD